MSKNVTPFIINLVKLPNGYAFQSLQEPENAATKKKNPPKEKPKNSTNRTIHRIFRELALDPQQPEELLNPIQEEPEPIRKLVEPEIEEEFSVQIKRENGLPESPATWYDQQSIHQIQKQSLPEFFDGRSYKTPGLYLKFRNFIVALYRKNPAQYLTKIACRRILRGDVNMIMRVHNFLEKQGVINFCVSKEGNYTFSSSIFSRVVNQQSKYGVAVDKVGDTDQQRTVEPIDITNITVTTVNKCFSKSNRVFCGKCQSICGIVWYKKNDENDKNAVLCIQCYQGSREEEKVEYAKTDIIKKIQTGTQDSKAVWSIEDNLKLLQFASNPTQTWQSLQDSFEKKKTFDDVMLQFMQFPIGNFDPYAEKLPEVAFKDPAEDHAKVLLQRFRKSKFSQKNQIDSKQYDLNNGKFTSAMVKMTKILCQKFQTSIKTMRTIQNQIEEGLFQLESFKTLFKQKIRDQYIPEMANKLQKQILSQQQSSSKNGQQQFNDGQPQIQEEEENEEEKNDNLEDYINNLEYN